MPSEDTKTRMSAVEKLDLVLRRLPDAKTRCVDVETSGLDWKKNYVIGYVITFGPAPEDSYYLPFWHGGGGNIGDGVGVGVHERRGNIHPGETALLKALNQPDTLVVGHNLSFDLKFLLAAGMPGTDFRCDDTQINACLLDEWQGSFALDECCKLAGVQSKKVGLISAHIAQCFPDVAEIAAKRPRDAMGHFWRLAGDDAVATEYAEGDGTSTWQLWEKQKVEIEKQELALVHDIECRLIPVLVRMTVRGVKVDMERLEWLKQHIDSEIERLMGQFPDGFVPRSAASVQQWMEKHGHVDWPLTPKRKAASFPENWLERYEAGQQVIKIRKYTNLRDSFILPLLETHIHKGRVHSEFHQLRGDEYGTITGRLSSSNPNLQQVPKRNKELGRLFRSVFIPDSSKLWGSNDYRQCEPVLLAVYSKCKVLIDGYSADPPVDAHQSVATALNIDRDLGKRINQTLLTGGGVGVLNERYGIPISEARAQFRAYFEKMPEIKDLQAAASARMKKYGYVFSLLGRRARLKDYNKAYVAVNRLLQCGNADILKLKMVQIDEYLRSLGDDPGADLLVNVHDALEFQFDPERREVYDQCLNIMQDFGPGQPIKLPIPLPVDSGEGPNWASATWGAE